MFLEQCPQHPYLQSLVLGILCLVLPAFDGEVHDFHVSRCVLQYKSGERALEVNQQIYADDLELALGTVCENMELRLGTHSEHQAVDSCLVVYLDQAFGIFFRNREIPYTLKDRQMTEDLSTVRIRLWAEDVPDLDEVSVLFNVLTEIFDDQKNILSFRQDNRRAQTFVLDSGKPVAQITLK